MEVREMKLGERIKMLRKEKKLTLEDVAKGIGVSRATVLKYESGQIETIPMARVHQIANFFDVSRPYLEGWTEERKANPSVNLDTVAEKLREGGYWNVGVMSALDGCENIRAAKITGIDLGTGIASAKLQLPRELFYRTLSERSGFHVTDDGDLMCLLTSLSAVKTEYDKVADTSQSFPYNPNTGERPGKDEDTGEVWYMVTTKNYTETKTGEIKCPAVYTISYKE